MTMCIKEIQGEIDNKIAFMLACPGKKEEDAHEICAGQTGTNLQKFINFCHEKDRDFFKYESMNQYRITNASMKVYYKTKDNRSIPLESDISEESNLMRLKEKLKDIDFVILLGESAQLAYSKLNLKYPNTFTNVTPLEHSHLSLQRINRTIKLSEEENKLTSSERSLLRLKIDFGEFWDKAFPVIESDEKK